MQLNWTKDQTNYTIKNFSHEIKRSCNLQRYLLRWNNEKKSAFIFDHWQVKVATLTFFSFFVNAYVYIYIYMYIRFTYFSNAPAIYRDFVSSVRNEQRARRALSACLSRPGGKRKTNDTVWRKFAPAPSLSLSMHAFSKIRKALRVLEHSNLNTST